MAALPVPSLPSSRTHAVNLVYKIPTDKFICSSFPTASSTKWLYSTQISVAKQWDYPDIPPAVWTVSLTIDSVSGKLNASVNPRNPGALLLDDVLHSPGAVLVEARIRSNADGPYDLVVGINGWAKAKAWTNTGLTAYYADIMSQSRFYLRKGTHMFLTLTFCAEKRCPRADLQHLIDSRTLTDCTLICEGQEFPTHRAILAAQSPVFTAMFQDEMKEKTTGVCKIDDIGRDVLEMVLKFSYSRAPLDGDGKLDQLWIAADKYDMQDLRWECERMMVQTISVENAVKYCQFAEERKLKELKMAAMGLIVQFSLEI